jgi:hypothetical protein
VVWRGMSGGPGGLYIFDSGRQTVNPCWTRLIVEDHDRDRSSIRSWNVKCTLAMDIIGLGRVHESQFECQTCPRCAHS